MPVLHASDQSQSAHVLRARRLIQRAEKLICRFKLDSIDGLLARAAALGESDPHIRARVLSLRASKGRMLGQHDSAIEYAKQALILWKELGNRAAEIHIRIEAARMLLASGNPTEALREGVSAMEDAESIADPAQRLPVHLEAMRLLAYVFQNMEQFDQAIAFSERGAECARQIGNAVIEGALLDSLGCTYGTMAYRATDAGDYEAASELLAKAMSYSHQGMLLARRAGHAHNEATARANLAEGLVQGGKPMEALALIESGGDVLKALPSLASHHLDTHGSILIALGRHDEAIAMFAAAFNAAKASHMALITCEHLADAYERNGDFRCALVQHKRFHALYKQNASEAAQRSARVAAVHLETRAARALADEHRSIAESLKRSNEQLTRHANDLMQLTLQDPLTGLANRRLMERLLNDSPDSFSIVMIDVDRFKVINDGWSHIVGDAVLQQIALLIRGCCRESDTPVRYGGDEFSILLRNSDEASSMAIAERVRLHVESFDWSRIAERLKVSVSVGYSCGTDQDDAASALVLADRRLYDAKHAGRNRVVGGTTKH